MRDIGIVGACGGQPVKIGLGVRRANWAGTHEFRAVQIGVAAALVEVDPAQLGATGPEGPFGG